MKNQIINSLPTIYNNHQSINQPEMKLPLPISSAINSIKWPLSMPSHPMYYEPILSLKHLRQPNSIPPTLKPILDRGALETVENLTLNQEDPSNKYHMTIALALIFLGNGFADEAHDLVTPLSWNEDTYFGGPTLCAQTDDSVVAMASYVHSLLHRREGFAQGEFGMIGYQNANYWASAARSRSDQCTTNTNMNMNTGMNNVSPLPYREVREAVINLSTDFGEEAERWCEQRIVQEGGKDDHDYWETRALHELCAYVSSKDDATESLKNFAEKAAEVELLILLKCCIERAGYEFEGNIGVPLVGDPEVASACTTSAVLSKEYAIDKDLAQSVCNKVSSAHIGGLQSSNSVTLRRVVKPLDTSDSSLEEERSLSAAAGLGCRLLGSPAVKFSPTNHKNESLLIILPMNEQDCIESLEILANNLDSSVYGGGALSPGDAFAFLSSGGEKSSSTDKVINTHGFYSFVECDPSDDAAVVVDRFHGSRGDTPTSVLQWSKGTIHRST